MRGATALGVHRYGLEQGLSPRARGNQPDCDPAMASHGSIALARGNCKQACGKLFGNGSIPACAGQPRAGPKGRLREWVYPSVHGASGHVY